MHATRDRRRLAAGQVVGWARALGLERARDKLLISSAGLWPREAVEAGFATLDALEREEARTSPNARASRESGPDARCSCRQECLPKYAPWSEAQATPESETYAKE